MPYQPGVTNISGQLLGQGISGLGDDLTNNLRQYAQNKMVAGQAVAQVEATIQANPEIAQFLTSDNAPPAASAAYNKLLRDGNLGLKDASVLAQFGQTYTQQKDDNQKRQLQQQQINLSQAQAQEYQQRVAMQQKAALDSTRNEAILKTAATPSAFTNGPDMTDDQRQPVQPAPADIYSKYLQGGGTPDPNVERFLGAGMQSEDRTALTQERAAAATERAATAQAMREAQLGKYKDPTEALQAAADAIKAAGEAGKGMLPEVVPAAGGTYSIKISKPYATHSDTAERAINNLQNAQDMLDEATAGGNAQEIAQAKAKVKFWSDRATTVSQRAPDLAARIAAIIAPGAGATTDAQAPQLSQQDQEALQWAQQNPTDPRSAQILQRIKANTGTK